MNDRHRLKQRLEKYYERLLRYSRDGKPIYFGRISQRELYEFAKLTYGVPRGSYRKLSKFNRKLLTTKR